MNRRLIREVYHREVLEASFTLGLPAGWEESVTGASAITTQGYDHTYGSHLALEGAGAAGSYAALLGPEIAIDSVAAVIVTVEGVTLTNEAQALFGLREHPGGGAAEVVASVVSGNSSSGHRARGTIAVGNGANYVAKEIVTPRSAAAAGVTVDLDYVLEIDVKAKTAVAYFDYLAGAADTTHWPTGKTLKPILLCYGLSGASGLAQVRRATVEIYR